MATFLSAVFAGWEAGQDLRKYQYAFVKDDGAGRIVPCGPGKKAIGVTLDGPPKARDVCQVAVGGQSKVRLGGVVAAGDTVAADDLGRAVRAKAGDVVLGTCTEGGDAIAHPGSIGSVLLRSR